MSMVEQPRTRRHCTGTYQAKWVAEREEVGDRAVLLEGIPAEVCDRCGDTLSPADSVRGMEAAIRRAERGETSRSVPVVKLVPPAPAA